MKSHRSPSTAILSLMSGLGQVFPSLRMVLMAILLWPVASSAVLLAAVVEIDPPPANTDPTLSAIRFQATESADGKLVPIRLRGQDARWQVIVEAIPLEGDARDITNHVQYMVEPAHVASVDATGLIIPLADGSAKIIAHYAGQTASNELQVEGYSDQPLVNFPNQVVPIFTKLGCNGGGCHGKAAGQNGFRLSLLGFEPREDYEHLVAESRGRRLSPASPDQSLLLTKSLNESPHGGGQRLGRDSYEYRLLRRWIAQAMPYGSAKDPSVVRIQVSPSTRRMGRNGQQQLSVLAHYSDGSVEDITRTAQYESNQSDMAEVTNEGMVKTHELAGDVAIMARYQGQVAVFQASIPLGANPSAWPTKRNAVDEAVFAKLATLGVPPAATCDDSTFIRRVTLDIAGRLPTPQEHQHFLLDIQPEKRQLLVNRLLDSPDYADHFAMKWNAILRNQRGGPDTRFGAYAFREWLRQALYDNLPYDRWVRELLTASGSVEDNPAVVWLREVPNTESRVEDAAQLFLGQRVQCARCHHHPYEKWSQKDYYQLSAFFNQMETKEGRSKQEPVFVSRFGSGAARHPKTGESLPPAGLDSPATSVNPSRDPRLAMADWLVHPDNPFFAKSLANRYWKHFLGKGLVEPEDDMRVTNPPSNPQLLDALSRELVQSGYDLKHLIRTICNSSTYQFSHEADSVNIQDQNSYARFYPRRLTAEVLLDAIDHVCGSQTSFENVPAGTRAVALPDTSFASYFLTVFGRPDSSTACECERTQSANLAQSLHLLNSKEVQAKLSDPDGRAAKWAQQSATPEGMDNAIRELYEVAFSRAPRPEESQVATRYLQARTEKLPAAFEDLIWAMINSKEFLFQH